MADDRTRFQGLNTDAPPDRLGDQLFRVENLAPRSPGSVAPRGGVSLVAHYQPTQSGRVVISDSLPGRTGDGFMIVVVNSTGTAHQVDGVFAFHPSSASPLAAGGGGGGDNEDPPGGVDLGSGIYVVLDNG